MKQITFINQWNIMINSVFKLIKYITDLEVNKNSMYTHNRSY